MIEKKRDIREFAVGKRFSRVCGLKKVECENALWISRAQAR